MPVECVGAFPDALAHGHHIRRGTLTINAESLAIDSGRGPHFSLSYDEIVAISLVPSSRRSIPAMHVRYREDSEYAQERGFTVAPRGPRTRIDGRHRLESTASLLASTDIPLTRDARGTHPRSLALSWPDARGHASELMVWSGMATAPVGGWMARDRGVCKVWVTDRSFFWCDPAGTGVNRLPVDDILDITIDVEQRIPAVAIALADAAGDRQELLFSFERDRYGDDNRHECQTLIHALSSRDIPVRSYNGTRLDWHPFPDTPITATVDDRRDDTLVAYEHGAFDEEGAPILDTRVSSFEAGCLAEIAVLNQQILNPDLATSSPSPEPAGQAILSDALDAVAAQIATGEITIADADGRVKRLYLLAESRSKLKAIREQQIRGIRSKSALLHQRTAVITSLDGLLG
jgi:hypothetical protein